jgi:hypothetical protein
LYGWRDSTIDVDIKAVPDQAVLRAIPRIKEELKINVELASPADFIPVRRGWEERSPFIDTYGHVTFLHFELAAQALSKIERGHRQDVLDVEEMLQRHLVDPQGLRDYFESIEADFYRFPALDQSDFRQALEGVLAAR